MATIIGGPVKIQNAADRYLFRGEINELIVRGGELRAKFNWLARAQGFPAAVKGWIKEDLQTYAASLEIYTISNIGPSGGGMGGGDRWCLTSFIAGETVTLYPMNGSRLDPARVIGLDNVTA